MFEIENRLASDRAGERMLSENELDATRFQGKHVATIAAKLKA